MTTIANAIIVSVITIERKIKERSNIENSRISFKILKKVIII